MLVEKQGDLITVMTDILKKRTEQLQTLIAATKAQKSAFDVDNLLASFGP
jgi:hypothetical protein